jgi:hypothetical protein
VNKTDTLYHVALQTRDHEPTSFENLLGDSIERAFAQGFYDLETLTAYLNKAGPVCTDGKAWTAESFHQEMSKLGQ